LRVLNLETGVRTDYATNQFVTLNFPSWDADGARIAFIGHTRPTGATNVYILTLSTGAIEQLTFNSVTDIFYASPVFDDTGDVLYVSFGATNGFGGEIDSDIYELDIATETLRALTANAQATGRLSYSSRHNALLYTGGEPFRIRQLNLGALDTLIIGGAGDDGASWWPAGNQLVFTRALNNQFDVLHLNADTGVVTQLVASPTTSEFDPVPSALTPAQLTPIVD
jgi:Tol biopolymer transport system component